MEWMPLFHDGSASLTHCIFVDIQPLPSEIAVGISQIYLKENHDLWDISDVKTALKKLKENEKTARFEERWVALNQEHDRIMADLEALNPTGNDE